MGEDGDSALEHGPVVGGRTDVAWLTAMADAAPPKPAELAKPLGERLRKSEKITAALAVIGIVVSIWLNLRKQPPQPIVMQIVPPEHEAPPGNRRTGGEEIVFHHGAVEVDDPEVENKVAMIAAAVKALPFGVQAEIVGDVGKMEAASDMLVTERAKLVWHLLVSAGVPADRLRILIRNDPTLPSILLNAISVRWSAPLP